MARSSENIASTSQSGQSANAGQTEEIPYSGKDTFSTLKRQKFYTQPSRDAPEYPALNELVAPHIDSFNLMFEGAKGAAGLLDLAMEDLQPKVMFDGKSAGADLPYGNKLSIRCAQVIVSRPMVSEKDKDVRDRKVYPTEARERLTTYKSRFSLRLNWSVNDGQEHEEIREVGMMPMMVKSARCNLRDMSPADLIRKHEEATEAGGYFIINGNERLIRYLVLPRRNHAVALIRSSFVKRGAMYTEFGVQIRCVREDESSLHNTIHYLSNGSATFRFVWRKQEYLIPIVMILKALVNASDREIFDGLVQNNTEDTFITDRVELLLRSFKQYSLFVGEQCLQYLGDKFRVVLECPENFTNAQVGAYLLERCVLVNLKEPRDKFRMLLFMVQKLYSIVSGASCADNPDSAQHQEVLLPGFLYNIIIKEKVDECLGAVQAQIKQDVRREVLGVDFLDSKYLSKIMQKTNWDIGSKLSYFLATGNLVSPTGLDLQQAAGFTIVAEKLNFYRYISHFRCIHRGAFFAELKTTTVRKLLPESWGFLCPVHTPDGSPCGLLNHLSRSCLLMTETIDASNVPKLLASLGMIQPFSNSIDSRKHICVQLDGCIIGWTSPVVARHLAAVLRQYKTEGSHRVPLDLEIGLVPLSKGGQYPGLYLFSSRSRMMRPVTYLRNNKLDHVGTFEQVYMDIACTPEEIEREVSTHVETSPTNVLSVIANLTPFSDFNQSPRNMYQCQMGKQTMGTPATALRHRTDNKLYRLQSGQTPIVRPALHDKYGMDSFPNGTNAVVCVISYTGYDMEDAMIINKSSHERGFGYGTIYKSQIIDLKDMAGASKLSSNPTLHFGFGPDIAQDAGSRTDLDSDGLIAIGSFVKASGLIAAYYDEVSCRTQFVKYKGDENAWIDEIRVLGNDAGDSECQKVHIKYRIPRSPVIGDKFASRHGQKGVCSQKWPAINMPFSESGMQPDVIINPHAFPSRMTIGMFVESLAGKAGALHGMAQDGTPFKFSEEDTPVNYFGEQLLAAGYNYYGNEPMYSGVTGQEFAADIYLGVVYYQRLRHMVNDKFQVRTTGAVDPLTRQPVKGRKRHGGIRFGEMERDALLAHGTAFVLQDRLMNSSDYSTTWVCKKCGSIISLGYEDVSLGQTFSENNSHQAGPGGEYCRICFPKSSENSANDVATRDIIMNASTSSVQQSNSAMTVIAIPYVFRYLCAELAAMGIRLSLDVRS